MYVGLPFSLCAEGSTQDFSYGGGGHFDWLVEFLTVVCNEKVAKRRGKLPSWANNIILIPGEGMRWLESNLKQVQAKARALAKAHTDCVFIFSAGPLSNVLIPLMWRANQANTYIVRPLFLHPLEPRTPLNPEPGLQPRTPLHPKPGLRRYTRFRAPRRQNSPIPPTS